MLNAEKELQKWAPVLEHADAPAITDSYKKAVTAKLLENTEVALREEAQASSFGTLNETVTRRHLMNIQIQSLFLLFVVQCLTSSHMISLVYNL